MQSNVAKEINQEHGAIFLTHKIILQDISILTDIENELSDRLLNGEIIVRDIFRRLEKRFLLFEDEQRQEKAKDIRDIGGRVIRKLQGKDKNLLSTLPENTILLSQRLLPSDTVFIDKNHVKAIITVEGSRGSHSAILARALDIPYVTINSKIEKLPNHSQAVVDSDNNSIFINPDELITEKYNKRIKEKAQETLSPAVSSKPVHIQGRKISLLANVSTEDEVMKAMLARAEGVGLFRVETIYMSSQMMPDEDYLLSRFMEILKPFQGKEINIRLLDIGSDKVPSYLDLSNEINPALGLRGIRLLLKHKKLLKTQLSACVRLNREIPVKILLPMVSLPWEIQKVRNMIKKMDRGEEIQIGAMIETPAAIFHFDEILNASDFISVGTNDLFQYTMTADRENKDVSNYFDKGFHVLKKTLKEIFRKSREANKDCTVCGESAGDNEYIHSMLEMGLTKFSVLPNLIQRVRKEIINYSETQG
jgi:phosphotransferase system enzyme I (PtsI)